MKKDVLQNNDIDLSKYDIFWYDHYASGYRRGASHAVSEETGISACGRDFTGSDNKTIDGGYQSCDEQPPDCKQCMKKLNIIPFVL